MTSKTAGVKPFLLVDIDGVLSLFGSRGAAAGSLDAGSGTAAEDPVEGAFHTIDGIPHFLSSTAAAHLLELELCFELVWASGWEEKADEYLPLLLGLPRGLPFIAFSQRTPAGARTTHAHWKLEAVSAYVGERPLAWVDDAFNPACHQWAKRRDAPTLLVSTAPEHGLTAREARTLLRWAAELQASG
jgi:HAD domain in Swiss Army Knife RNA repair proteins